MDDIGVLMWLVLHHVVCGESLKPTAAGVAGVHVIDISPVALHVRMRQLGPYLAQLRARLIGTRDSFEPGRWASYKLIVCNLSAVSGLAARGTDAWVHSALRLPDLWLAHVVATESTGGESLRRYAPAGGQPWLADRGQCRPAGIGHVVQAGADALVRHHFHSRPHFDEQDKALV